MTRLAQSNGDDHPEAAEKNLLDAGALLAAGRPDGAAYLSGYVVECALKSLWLHQTGAPMNGRVPWRRNGHELSHLHANAVALASLAGSAIAKYVGPTTQRVLASPIAGWRPEMRYQPAKLDVAAGRASHSYADAVYKETVLQMRLDGVL